MGDNRPSVYFDPDVDLWIYRASALGSCERELVAHRRGMSGSPTPDWLQVRFDEGHDWEDRILARTEDDTGQKVTDRQRQLLLPVGKHAAVRGSIDGYIDRCIVDAKFLGPDLYAKLKAKGIAGMEQYAWQQAAYAHAWNLFVEGGPLKADRIMLAMGLKDIEGEGEERRIVGIKEMHYLYVPLKELPTAAKIKARVMRLEKMAQGDDWPACPQPFQYPCPFDHLHDEVDDAVEVEGEWAEKLEQAAECNRLARENEGVAKELKAKARGLVEEVLKAQNMGVEEGHKLRAGDVECTWVYSKTEAAVIEKYERKESVRMFPKFTERKTT